MYYCCLFVLQLIFLSVVLNLGFPGGKESTCQAGEAGLIPWLGRFPGDENVHPLQYSCLGNPMDRGAWQESQRVRHDLVTKQKQHQMINELFSQNRDFGANLCTLVLSDMELLV